MVNTPDPETATAKMYHNCLIQEFFGLRLGEFVVEGQSHRFVHRVDPTGATIQLNQGILKPAVLFSPGIGTSNLGDEIIMRAVTRELRSILDGRFVVKYGTHTPLRSRADAVLRRQTTPVKNCLDADLKFICGSNILKERIPLLRPSDWAVTGVNRRLYSGSILLGVGMSGGDYPELSNRASKIYRRMLSRSAIHAVRDEVTLTALLDLGFNAVNTGCPTTWGMTPRSIADCEWGRARTGVVFTLTDYNRNPRSDYSLIEILRKKYSSVFFWPQGIGDLEYFNQISGQINDIKILRPTIQAFSSRLSDGDLDYVGTRLHGGILAQEFGCRTLILETDRRAKDMAATASFLSCDREDLKSIRTILSSWPEPNFISRQTEIHRWKNQF